MKGMKVINGIKVRKIMKVVKIMEFHDNDNNNNNNVFVGLADSLIVAAPFVALLLSHICSWLAPQVKECSTFKDTKRMPL